MPPVYTWTNEEGKTIDVMRSFDDYLVPPTADELTEAGLPTDVQYTKLISKGIRTVATETFRRHGMKGSWG